ncbi:MAG: hypothetical protein K6E17_07530, partial [Clostridiales bacterium]|nr:hypothetical protein [Clostridiales bacterium]
GFHLPDYRFFPPNSERPVRPYRALVFLLFTSFSAAAVIVSSAVYTKIPGRMAASISLPLMPFS